MGQLENLGFVRDGSEWAADHAHAAGYAFVLIDGCASLFVTFDGFYAAGAFAGAFFVGDGVVGTDGFASSAMDAFILVDKGFSVYHGDGAFGTGEHTGMCDAAAAHVADFVFVGFACGTCRWDYLHKRWFVIFLVNVAGFYSVGQMDGTVLRAEGKSHGQADAFARNGSFTVDTFAVFRTFLYNIVGNGFNIVDQGFVRGFKSDLCNFGKNLSPDLFYWCVKISHRCSPLQNKLIKCFPRTFYLS